MSDSVTALFSLPCHVSGSLEGFLEPGTTVEHLEQCCSLQKAASGTRVARLWALPGRGLGLRLPPWEQGTVFSSGFRAIEARTTKTRLSMSLAGGRLWKGVRTGVGPACPGSYTHFC